MNQSIVPAEDGRTYDHFRHAVRIAVGRWTPVFQVAAPLLGDVARNADGDSAVGNSRREIVDVAGLVATRQSPLVVVSVAWIVHANVTIVVALQLLDGCLDFTEIQIK